MNDVKLLSCPKIILQDYFGLALKSLGRSVTRQGDAAGMKMDNLNGYLCALSEMSTPGSKPQDILKNPGALLRHIHYSFLIYCSRETRYQILEHCSIDTASGLCPDGNYLVVASGNLQQWRESVINGTKEQSPTDLRQVLDMCMHLLEKEGLSKLWADYTKVPMKDRTLRLVHN